MEKVLVSSRGVNLYYDSARVLKDITFDIREKQVTALIGPSGCGKSSFLRCINRMNDFIPSARVEGAILVGDSNIYAGGVDVIALRRNVGMVFQKPNPFPMSIYDNVAYGPRLHGVKQKERLDDIVKQSLVGAALWEEVKDKLKTPGTGLSGGQQQRLCIARALAPQPEILMLDEPCSGLDPISTLKIEQALQTLKERYTIILVSHNVQQASRATDRVAFILMGELVEWRPTADMFTTPRDQRTADFLQGRFG